MVPESIITRRRDDLCLVLYAYLDLKGGKERLTQRGYQYIGDRLGLQARTVREHAQHLADDGLIELHTSSGKGAPTMRVAHNPGRKLVRDGVELTPRPVRSRTESGWTRYAGSEHAEPHEGRELEPCESVPSTVPDRPGDERATSAARGSGHASDAPGRSASGASRLRSPRSEIGLEPEQDNKRPATEGNTLGPLTPVAGADALPPSYESDEALSRIRSGLEQAQFAVTVAETAAQVALAEAPFTAPTPDGWSYVCRRARELAREGASAPSQEVGHVG